jgi:heme exporter protein D
MEKLTEVLAMGGYGAYIWPSFLVAVLVMAGMATASLRSLRRAHRALAHLQETSSDPLNNET